MVLITGDVPCGADGVFESLISLRGWVSCHFSPLLTDDFYLFERFHVSHSNILFSELCFYRPIQFYTWHFGDLQAFLCVLRVF